MCFIAILTSSVDEHYGEWNFKYVLSGGLAFIQKLFLMSLKCLRDFMLKSQKTSICISFVSHQKRREAIVICFLFHIRSELIDMLFYLNVIL